MDKPKDKGGRKPIVFDEEQAAQVEALGAVLSIEQIADYFGMAKATFYHLMERQPEVSVRYKKGKAQAISDVSGKLLTQAKEGNITAIIFYLKTQAGWRETDKATDEDDTPPPIKVVISVKDARKCPLPA